MPRYRHPLSGARTDTNIRTQKRRILGRGHPLDDLIFLTGCYRVGWGDEMAIEFLVAIFSDSSDVHHRVVADVIRLI